MIIEPKIRGFICTTAHPLGCAENIKKQIKYVKSKRKEHELENTLRTKKIPNRVLIIGASTGYGLASRITAAYMCDASTIGVMYEKEPETPKESVPIKRTATPGYYNTKAFEKQAHEDGYYAESINGDAFSIEIKLKVVDLIKESINKVDMVIYSLASPRRTDKEQVTYTSVLKTIGEEFTSKSLNLRNNEINEYTVMPATREEAESTVKVMGGEDWLDWIEILSKNDVLEDGVITLAYSYIGPELTYPIYKNGTIGLAKDHLHETADEINQRFKDKNIKAYISVNKALVTQASAAIPIVPLYISILYHIMKEKGIHEGLIEQMERLFYEHIFNTPLLDDEGRIRMDDLEMRKDVQDEIKKIWGNIDSSNVNEYADIKGYWDDFYHMFGFGFDTVDYSIDVEV